MWAKFPGQGARSRPIFVRYSDRIHSSSAQLWSMRVHSQSKVAVAFQTKLAPCRLNLGETGPELVEIIRTRPISNMPRIRDLAGRSPHLSSNGSTSCRSRGSLPRARPTRVGFGNCADAREETGFEPPEALQATFSFSSACADNCPTVRVTACKVMFTGPVGSHLHLAPMLGRAPSPKCHGHLAHSCYTVETKHAECTRTWL